MRGGVKKIVVLVLAVLLVAGISGAGALMQISSYEDTVVNIDSGAVVPSQPEEDSTPEPQPLPSEPQPLPSEPQPLPSEPQEPPLTEPEPPSPSVGEETPAPEVPLEETLLSEARFAMSLPSGILTQAQVNEKVAELVARLVQYEADPMAYKAEITAVAQELIALPHTMAYRAPLFRPILLQLEQLSGVVATPANVVIGQQAQALNILPTQVAQTGASVSALLSGQPVELTIDAMNAPTHRLPSGVTARDMVVLTTALSHAGVAVQPPLPVTVTMPLPKGARRMNAVLLFYAQGSSKPRYIHPQMDFGGSLWYMTFTLESFGELVLVNTVSTNTSTEKPNPTEIAIYDHWIDVIERVESTEAGGEVYTYTKGVGARNVPVKVLEALHGRDVTLHINFGAEKDIVINGKRMKAIPSGQVFYLFWDLYNVYATDTSTADERGALPTPADGGAYAFIDTPILNEAVATQYAGTPQIDNVQNVKGASGSAPTQSVIVAAPEQAASRGDAESNLLNEATKPVVVTDTSTDTSIDTPIQASVATKPTSTGGTFAIPIWAPALLAGGVLLGLMVGGLAASFGKKRETQQGRLRPNDENQ